MSSAAASRRHALVVDHPPLARLVGQELDMVSFVRDYLEHPDRDSERAIAAGLSETITAALANANGHVAGTEAPGVASGTQPDNQREVG